MDLDLRGRLRNITLKPRTESLLPVFEAVVNSIHAIEDSGRKGAIDIYIERDRTRTSLETEGQAIASYPIRLSAGNTIPVSLLLLA